MTNPVPDSRAVHEFHRNSDLDSRPEAMHHTLGTTRNSASPGNHIHDGLTSYALLSATITGSRSSNTVDVLTQVLTALSALGITNNTTA